MNVSSRARIGGLAAVLVAAFSMVALDSAEARRGGSFGSRGGRTFQSAPATSTAPRTVTPIQRSMTPAPSATSGLGAGAQRPGGFFGGFGGSLLRGLAIGGLIGLLFGGGFGGLGGVFSLLLQVLLIGGGIWLVLRLLRGRQASAPAMAGGPSALNRMSRDDRSADRSSGPKGGAGFSVPSIGSLGGARAARPANPDEIGVTKADLDVFEQALAAVQDAYTREDYAALRRLTTPEMMGYLSEELGQNASNGVKNEVSDVRLLQGDVAESWREGATDYATVAMRYASIDVTRERGSGRLVSGDAERPSETTEVWTFTRQGRAPWLLSAIQDA